MFHEKTSIYFVGNFSENNRNFDSDIAVCSVGFPVSFFILACVVGGRIGFTSHIRHHETKIEVNIRKKWNVFICEHSLLDLPTRPHSWRQEESHKTKSVDEDDDSCSLYCFFRYRHLITYPWNKEKYDKVAVMPTVADVQSGELISPTDDNVEVGIDPTKSKPPPYTGTPEVIHRVQRGISLCQIFISNS